MIRLTAGFTLVEAAVVLTVFGFGVTVALPAYRDYKLREEVELVIQSAASAKVLVEEFATANGGLPDSAAIALPFPTQTLVHSTAWAGSSKTGAITVSTKSRAKHGRPELDARAIVLRASYNATSKHVEWICGGTRATTVSPRYLPASCK